MGPTDNLTLGSNSDSTSLSVPKLRDDGSNWADCEPRLERALGMKGLWRHVVGTAIAPKPYAVVAGVLVLADGITQASDDQVESKELKNQAKKLKNCEGNVGHSQNGCHVEEYPVYPRHRRSVVQHETQRQWRPPATHLSELKQHFQLMLQQHENLMKMGSKISETRLNMMIMSSLPKSYRPIPQTITASKWASALTSPGSSMQRKMKPSDLIVFLIEEAQHHIINNERMQNSDQALAAHVKRKGKGNATWVKGDEKALNADSNVVCHNCKKEGP